MGAPTDENFSTGWSNDLQLRQLSKTTFNPWNVYRVYNGKKSLIRGVDPFGDDYSVHDLQNLYFALTGEELTIKE